MGNLLLAYEGHFTGLASEGDIWPGGGGGEGPASPGATGGGDSSPAGSAEAPDEFARRLRDFVAQFGGPPLPAQVATFGGWDGGWDGGGDDDWEADWGEGGAPPAAASGAGEWSDGQSDGQSAWSEEGSEDEDESDYWLGDLPPDSAPSGGLAALMAGVALRGDASLPHRDAPGEADADGWSDGESAAEAEEGGPFTLGGLLEPAGGAPRGEESPRDEKSPRGRRSGFFSDDALAPEGEFEAGDDAGAFAASDAAEGAFAVYGGGCGCGEAPPRGAFALGSLLAPAEEAGAPPLPAK